MKKLYFWVVLYSLSIFGAFATDKFEILPDLPEVTNGLIPVAQAKSVTNNIDISGLGINSVGQEPSAISVIFSLLIVILLIYITGILYAKFNKLGINSFHKGQRNCLKPQVSIESTISLGNNKTLHVVELDGKRMLIGASPSSIQLIKDLGSSTEKNIDENYSHIEIPNIKIPRIEIPKIEIPFINFSKLATKTHRHNEETESKFEENNDINFESGDMSDMTDKDKVISCLFDQKTKFDSFQTDNTDKSEYEENLSYKHTINPADYELHKKYLK